MNLTIRVYPVGTGLLSQTELNQIAAWHEAEFSNLPISKQFEWTVGGQFNVLLDVDGEFSGFVGLMQREAIFDGERKLIAGIRGLVIDPNRRNQGLGKVIMREAHKVVFRTMKADYGFLLCLGHLESFYQSLSWQTLHCHVSVENQSQKIAWPEKAMILCKDGDSHLGPFNENDLMGKAF